MVKKHVINEIHLENCIDTLKECAVKIGKEIVLDKSKVDSLQFSIAITKVLQAIEDEVITKNSFKDILEEKWTDY